MKIRAVISQRPSIVFTTRSTETSGRRERSPAVHSCKINNYENNILHTR